MGTRVAPRAVLAVSGVVLVAGLVAACGGSSNSASTTTTTTAQSQVALLSNIVLFPSRVVFEFRSAPSLVKAATAVKSRLQEFPSGNRVLLSGAAAITVRFSPASGAEHSNGRLKLVYKGQRRLLPGTQGIVREVVRTRDSNSTLVWAIGTDQTRRFHVSRNGSNVTISFS